MPNYSQGARNSCGAWCAAHRIGIRNRPQILASDKNFINAGEAVWGLVKFQSTSRPTTLPLSPPPNAGDKMFTDWCANSYSDPWKIAWHLRSTGVNSELYISTMAPAGVMNPPAGAFSRLQIMRWLLENLQSRRGLALTQGDLTATPIGGYAICICREGALALHYVLFRRRSTGWQVYDPRSSQLNWRSIGAPPTFLGTFQTTLPGERRGNYTFLGVFIRC